MQTNYTPKDIQRFWSKVDQSGGPDACWVWTAGCVPGGYGVIRFGYHGKSLYAHRVSWVLAHGDIPDDLQVLHHCDQRPCCNPKHLFLGTMRDNLADMVQKGRQAKGMQRWNCKLTDAQVAEIRQRYAIGNVSQYKLAHIFGVRQDHISRIVNYKKRT